MPAIKPYNTHDSHSYALGLYPCFSLLEHCPSCATRLLISDKAEGEGVEKLRTQCSTLGIREEIAPKALQRISGKANCYAGLVFEKQEGALCPSLPHVVLHNPMDEGNVGTILRTLLGLGLQDIAIIRPAVDPFEPRVVRATMGALFAMRIRTYPSFEVYREEFPTHSLYPFMLDGDKSLDEVAPTHTSPYTLIFGNEGKGLPAHFASLGQAVRIAHNDKIDSLNLAVAVAIGAYAFVHS